MTGRQVIGSDLVLLAASIAQAHRLPRIAALGPAEWPESRLAYPGLDLVELVDQEGGRRSLGASWARRPARWPPAPGRQRGRAANGLAEAVALVDVGDGIAIPESSRALLEAPVAIVRADADPDALAMALHDAGADPTLVGWDPGGAALAIVDRQVPAVPPATPDDFRVLAIVTSYNEADIIESTIAALRADGVDVHVIDNWSSDGTFEIASRLAARGGVTVERYPAEPVATYEWASLLGRVEEVAARTPASWYIHHDADERRSGPWEGSLRDALWRADQSGFNAVDHIVLTFYPTDDAFVPGSDPATHFHSFEFGASPDLLVQVKAWRATSGPVRLVESGGHDAAFAGRRVFPYRFLLKHYPIRSQAHGERKVLGERLGRWNERERARGWHVQYDGVAAGHRFVRSPDGLLTFDEQTRRRYLVPLVSGIGVAPRPVPSWATRGRMAAGVFRAARAAAGSPLAMRARRAGLARAPIVGRPARWVRRRLLAGR
jgi:hypothetical protein